MYTTQLPIRQPSKAPRTNFTPRFHELPIAPRPAILEPRGKAPKDESSAASEGGVTLPVSGCPVPGTSSSVTTITKACSPKAYRGPVRAFVQSVPRKGRGRRGKGASRRRRMHLRGFTGGVGRRGRISRINGAQSGVWPVVAVERAQGYAARDYP
ncbi:hypothetical protein KM043_013418 [Ampulex compressa]|nr:hypothetical protein KM043_013418 [Ampulex compressa]